MNPHRSSRQLRRASTLVLAAILWFWGTPGNAQTTLDRRHHPRHPGRRPSRRLRHGDQPRRGDQITTETNQAGDFVVPDLLPDTYTVKVTLEGFKTLEREQVVLTANERLSVGVLTLELGLLAETVTVTARVTQVQMQSAERSFSVDSTAIENLAVNGRSPLTLTRLAPGISNAGGLGMSVNGSRGGVHNLTVDGVSNMDTGNNGILVHPVDVEDVPPVEARRRVVGFLVAAVDARERPVAVLRVHGLAPRVVHVEEQAACKATIELRLQAVVVRVGLELAQVDVAEARVGAQEIGRQRVGAGEARRRTRGILVLRPERRAIGHGVDVHLSPPAPCRHLAPGSGGERGARVGTQLREPAAPQQPGSLAAEVDSRRARTVLRLRLDAFNALNHAQFSGLNSTIQFRSLTDLTPVNLPFDEAGNLVRPTGFGAVTAERGPRVLQLLTRLEF